jgi:hypothetical protein
MSDFSDFVARLKDYANREDWSDDLVAFFIRQAEQKLNQELRISWMIQTEDGLIASRCAPLPTDWLEMSLVRLQSGVVPDGFIPIRYKARDEFFQLPDGASCNYYTIEGRQIFFGGAPDSVNGKTVRLSYYGKVPAFADDTDSWVYTEYPNLYLSAAMMHAYMHAVGEEQQAALAKQLAEDEINKLNAEWLHSKASGSRLTRTRVRSFG